MTLLTAPDDFLYRTCSSLEIEFLNTIVDGEFAMNDFAKRLTKLQESSEQSLSPCTSKSTAAIAYTAASSISIISSSFIELESISKDIENDLFTDVTDVLQHLTLHDCDSSSGAIPSKSTQGENLDSLYESF